jgi:thioesterase domain-containing protein
MSADEVTYFLFPGANGHAPDVSFFRAGPDDSTRFIPLKYPKWQRYITPDFSAEALISDLISQIAAAAPHDTPICLVGISIGGHFGYATAQRLEAADRKILGFCAIDTFMIRSAAPRPGWHGRALTLGFRLLRQGRFKEFANFLRSRFWRALLRLAGEDLRNRSGRSKVLRYLITALTREPMLEEELTMRLLLSETSGWIGSLDKEPIPLKTSALHIRTAEAAGNDEAWRRRCSNMQIVEVPGTHQSMFEPENAAVMRARFLDAARNWRLAAGG